MATNIVTTNYFRELMATQQVDLSGDNFAIALMGIHVQSATAAQLRSVSAWSDVSAYEASAVGYSATSLQSLTVSAINNSVVSWDGNNVTWNNITLSPYGYAIYRVDDGMVLGFVEFTSAPIEAVNGSITIQWNVNGIANIL